MVTCRQVEGDRERVPLGDAERLVRVRVRVRELVRVRVTVRVSHRVVRVRRDEGDDLRGAPGQGEGEGEGKGYGYS